MLVVVRCVLLYVVRLSFIACCFLQLMYLVYGVVVVCCVAVKLMGVGCRALFGMCCLLRVCAVLFVACCASFVTR